MEASIDKHCRDLLTGLAKAQAAARHGMLAWDTVGRLEQIAGDAMDSAMEFMGKKNDENSHHIPQKFHKNSSIHATNPTTNARVTIVQPNGTLTASSSLDNPMIANTAFLLKHVGHA